MPEDDQTRQASCLCGAVRLTTRGPLGAVSACHCSQCRKQTGHHYASTSVADDRLTVEGGENVAWYRASAFASRGFCRTCGSTLFWKGDDSPSVSIMAGLFDDPLGVKIAYHIFCADKGDYYEIADGLPHYPQSRP